MIMKPNAPDNRSRLTGPQINQIVIGVVLFGVLMGIREEFHSIWLRAVVAGCAGGVLGLLVLWKARC
jgi:hypothetical protein